MIKTALVTFTVLVAVASFAADSVIVEDRATLRIQLTPFSDRSAQLQHAADSGDTRALVSELRRIDIDPQLGIAVRDHLMETGVIALSRSVPNDDAWRFIASLKVRPVATYVRLVDEHGNAVVPLYDIAAAARFTEKAWQAADAGKIVATELRSGRWRPADYLAPPGDMPLDAWQAGTSAAFATAGPKLLDAYRAQLLAALLEGQRVDDLILQFAQRGGDTEFYFALASHGDSRVLMKGIRGVRHDVDAGSAFTFLERSASRRHVASAAILEIGELARNDDTALTWLIRQLGDTANGGSAALALSRLPSHRSLDAVRQILTGNATELTKLRAALVLRLDDSLSAQTMRRQLQSSADLSEPLIRALQ